MSADAPRDAAARARWLEKMRHAARRRGTRRWRTRALRAGRALFYPLPLFVALPLGEAAGLLAWAFAGRIRRLAATHLDLILGDRLDAGARRRIARAVFVNLGRSVAERLVVRRTGIEAFERRLLPAVGEEHLRAAAAGRRGAIIVTAHFGNFEMLAGVVRRRVDLRVVGRTPREEDVDDLVIGMRRELGVETLSQSNPRGILRALREGAFVGLLPDQDIERLDGIFVPFLGMPAYTPTGPATMALAAGVPILPIFFRREGRSRHRIVIHPPLVPDPAAKDREAEVRRLTEGWSAIVEEEVSARPEQWAWFHRRWETTPESLARFRARPR